MTVHFRLDLILTYFDLLFSRKQYYHEPMKKKKNSESASNGSVPANGGLGKELFGDTFINSYKNGAVQTSNQSTIM